MRYVEAGYRRTRLLLPDHRAILLGYPSSCTCNDGLRGNAASSSTGEPASFGHWLQETRRHESMVRAGIERGIELVDLRSNVVEQCAEVTTMRCGVVFG